MPSIEEIRRLTLIKQTEGHNARAVLVAHADAEIMRQAEDGRTYATVAVRTADEFAHLRDHFQGQGYAVTGGLHTPPTHATISWK